MDDHTFYFQMDKNEEFKLNTQKDYFDMGKRTYKSAVGYFILSQKCLDMLLSEYNDAICTNISFSCELFLKSIIYKNQINYRGKHSLYELYKLLPIEIQNKIKTNHACGNIRRESFETELKQIEKVFEVFRYQYERKRMACNIQFLIELLMALHDYAYDLFEYKEKRWLSEIKKPPMIK